MKKLSSFLLAIVMALACVFGTATPTITSYAAEQGNETFKSYSISSYNVGETNDEKNLNQHVVLTLNYDKTVTITDEEALNNSLFGETPTLEIKIAGMSIASESYHRPCTYKVGEDKKSLLIDIGNCVDANNAASFTAIYNGSFTVSGSISGISLDGTAVTSDVNIAETRIPTGITVDKVSGWDTNSVTVKVSHEANIRGMYHFALYNVVDASTTPVSVVPVTASVGQMNSYTMTSHAHNFYMMPTTTLATSMTNTITNSLPEGYTASVKGDEITITSPNTDDKLRFYIFDDNFIQSKDCVFKTGVSFAKDTASLGGYGYVSYQLKLEDGANFADWAANATVTVDDVTYKTVTEEEPTSYTEDNYAYFEEYVSSRGTSYYLYLSTNPLNCPKEQGSKHNVVINSKKYAPVNQEVKINNYAADSFRVRYIDGDGNIITSKAWTMDELKKNFKATTQDYNTVCGMRGFTAFHAQGVLLNDLFEAANIKPDDSMTIQVRTNDSTTQGINDPDDSIGELNEGYYRMGTFDYSDLYAPRYYYAGVFYNARKYSALGGQTIYDALKSTNGQLIRDPEIQQALRKVLASDNKYKEEVTPLIAWSYSETVFGKDGKDIDDNFNELASKEKAFRFLFGLKEENGSVSTQTTTWSATYCAFGVDVIAKDDHSVADTIKAIDAIGTVTENSKDAIEAAKTAYNALSDDAKKLVTNASDLTKAEETYKKLTTDYTITFNANGGKASATSITKKEDQKYGTLPTCTRDNYKFLGWYTAKTGGEKVSANTVCKGDATVYARWQRITYTLTFKANGGKASKASVTKNAGSKYGTLPTCTKAGYTFDGWYTAKTGGKKVSANTVCKGNATLYAHWSKVTVKKASQPTLKAGTKQIKVTIKKMTGVKGYEVRYATKADMAKAKKVSTTKTSATISKLTKNKTYYVQVRAYKVDSAKKNVYGSWSKKVSVKVTK